MTAAIKQNRYTDILDEATALLDDIDQYPISISIEKLNDMLSKLVQCKGNDAIRLAHKLENINDSLRHSMNVVHRERLLLDRGQGVAFNGDPSFHRIRYDSYLSQEDVASMFQVHLKTVKRWDSGAGKPSKSVLIVMKTIAYGLHCFPGAGSQWEGWKIQHGVLYDPEEPRRYYHTTGTIRAWHIVSQMLHHQEGKEYSRNKAISQNKNIQALPSMDAGKWDTVITVLQESLNEALDIEVKKS